ncbi:MAG TPA: M28 family peptidase [Caulobacter sp.]|nr:M28 family peptidase [Caulobacter sp.]
MKQAVIAALATVLSVGSAASSPPPTATAEWVAGFAQPTPRARLDHLTAMLADLGLEHEVRPFTLKRAAGEGHNVIITLGEGDRDILLTAHYDARRLKDGRLADGVVDNAASVVALARAAVLLRGGLQNHRLRIIFFDQEELGLLGAKAYAASDDGRRAAAIFNFDINAYGDTPYYALPGDAENALLKGVIEDGCRAANAPCRPFEVYPSSDHRAFWLRHIPATSFSYLPRAEVEALDAFMRRGRGGWLNPLPVPAVLRLIHSPNDRITAVDPATVDRTTRLAVAMARAADARR